MRIGTGEMFCNASINVGVHEVSHALLHDREVMDAEGILKDRITKEVEAESNILNDFRRRFPDGIHRCPECFHILAFTPAGNIGKRVFGSIQTKVVAEYRDTDARAGNGKTSSGYFS